MALRYCSLCIPRYFIFWTYWWQNVSKNIFLILPKIHKKTNSRSGDIKHFCPLGGGECTLSPLPPFMDGRNGWSRNRASYIAFELMAWVIIFRVRVFWVGIFWGGMHQGGIFWVGVFQGGIFWVGVFQGGIFLEPNISNVF